MPIYQVVILAIIQGLTEFLPVSSTAHLALAHWLFGWDFHAATAEIAKQYDFSFDVALHAGTLLAVILYFFRDWLQIIAQAFGIGFGRDRQLAQNRGLLWLLLAGTIPVGLAGLAFGKHAEGDWRSPWVIAATLIVVGVLMWIGDGIGARNKDLASVGVGDAGAIGVAQAFAIVPGVSRSGITITAGLFRNLDREAAARFSFLLSTPAIGAAAAKAYWDLHKHGGIPHDMRIPVVVGAIVSAVVGMFVIAFLLDYLRHHSLRVFAWYRIALGALVIALTLAGVSHGG
ncbi:MAG TPA: undecaprenyl-diphosphate phosphatase [Bryobacteraceae bacterium]|nr:undecaprenyl-diphosphate phosphatase [Bryobacteraceae bacterium]